MKETRSTRGSSVSGAAASGAGAEDQVADARGEPGLLEQPHQDDAGVRRELARLEHEGVAGGQAGRDLPGGLQQRVVPGRDQRADAERLVDDPAEHVGAAGVDDPAGVLGGDVAVVAEHRDHVGDVVLRSRRVACRCPCDSASATSSASRSSRSATRSSRSPRSRAGVAGHGPWWKASYAAATAARASSADGLVDLGDERAVGRAADGPAAARGCACPRPVDVELRHLARTVLSPRRLCRSCAIRNALLMPQRFATRRIGDLRHTSRVPARL